MEPEVIFSGISSSIIVLMFFIVGINVALVYKRTKQSTYIFVGLFLILVGENWYPSSISFIIAFFNNERGLLDIPQAYVSIGITLLPLGFFFWMVAMTEMMYKDKKKVILFLIFIVGTVFEILFLYGLFFDMALVGDKGDTIVDGDYGPVSLAMQLFYLVLTLITAIRFGIFSRKSNNPETKLKGTFFLLGVLCLGVGAVFDILSPGRIYFLISGRAVLVLSSIMFYFGFVLPEKVKKLFVK
ncbi:MAG: hypothetical protein ACFFAS_16225 [Promethearchaeota archaeon]